MKKRLLYILTFGMLCGCSDFLDEVDKDQLIPVSTEHYEAVLLNEFSKEQACFSSVDFMTDNLQEYSYSSESGRKLWKPIFTWQMEIEIDENGKRVTSNNKAWADIYEDVAIANYVMELIDEADGSVAERDFIKGEAYFIRAWSYFLLVNLYGLPYRVETAKADLGVPLRMDNGMEQIYQRATVEESYGQVIADLTEAKRLIKQSGLTKSKYHPSLSACDLLFSRVYLYMKNWEKAEQYATAVITEHSLSMMVETGAYVKPDRSDILYSVAILNASLSSAAFDKGWQVSSDLIRLYNKDNDVRFKAFFKKTDKIGEVYYTTKQQEFTQMGMTNLRVAEAYLNRAEARFHLNGDAVSDMQVLVGKRYLNPQTVFIPASGADLLDFILTERRRELCFEDHHRWFDLRRMENRPNIVHVYTLTDELGNKQGSQSYTLWPNDPNYVLPIPLEERDNNPLIRNNERLEKLPDTDMNDDF